MPSPDETHASDFSEVHVINIESDLDIDSPVIKVDKQDSAMNGNGERCFHFSYLRSYDTKLPMRLIFLFMNE